MLKLAQREEALARGIELIEWTFDPLEIKNAYFNIERLGAIVRRYRAEPVRHRPPALCTAACRRIAASPNGGSRARACEAILAATPREPAGRSRSASRSPPTSRAFAANDPQRAREIQKEHRRAVPERTSTRGLAVIGFERVRRRAPICWGAWAMKIEQIILRQIRMPLVHFFETSFGRTYRARHHPGGSRRATASPAGAKSRRRESVLQRGVDRVGMADRCAITSPRACWAAISTAPQMWSPLTAHIRGHNMARGGLEAAVWDLEARLQRRAAVEADRRRRAARNPLRRFHRHSGFGRQLLEKIETRTGRRLSAHQDEDQAGLGCRRDPRRCASDFPPSS